MIINPRQLQKLGSLAEAKKHIQTINYGAQQDRSQMEEARGHLNKLSDLMYNIPMNKHNDNYFTAENHISDAINSHASGNYRQALDHIDKAHEAVKQGETLAYRSYGRGTDLTEIMGKVHGAINDYRRTMVPAKYADNRAQRSRGTISVTVDPDYVAKTNPKYAKRREHNQTALKNRNARQDESKN